MPTNTVWVGGVKLYLYSGEFTSTLKTSLDVTFDGSPTGIAWDGTNTPWSGDGNNKLYLTSGQFSSTLKDSQSVSVVSLNALSSSLPNSPWTAHDTDKLYLQSGQFVATIKTSLNVFALEDFPRGVSWDGLNTPWTGSTANKAYLQSGQFDATLKTSRDYMAYDADMYGISWSVDASGTPMAGAINSKLFLFSGQFTATLKTSITTTETAPRDVDSTSRLGLPPPENPVSIYMGYPKLHVRPRITTPGLAR